MSPAAPQDCQEQTDPYSMGGPTQHAKAARCHVSLLLKLGELWECSLINPRHKGSCRRWEPSLVITAPEQGLCPNKLQPQHEAL